ncbi:MAG: PAS domain-containing protein [Bacteroidales bacterium]
MKSGSFTKEELNAILNTLPIDMTFVDRNDKVKYFSQGKERIFQRSRAILNRDVLLCHPPSSAGIVEKILDDFSNNKEESAPFWIQMGDKFIHIEYFALKDENGKYLGTLEVSQDLSEKENCKAAATDFVIWKKSEIVETNIIITPKTKVAELLDAYPQLEDVLIDIAPTFKKLKNPVLRRTIARVATLQQAASVGGVPVDVIINKLRGSLGQEEMKNMEQGNNYAGYKPTWFDENTIAKSFDVGKPLHREAIHWVM